jgi:hypothetical protein
MGEMGVGDGRGREGRGGEGRGGRGGDKREEAGESSVARPS